MDEIRHQFYHPLSYCPFLVVVPGTRYNTMPASTCPTWTAWCRRVPRVDWSSAGRRPCSARGLFHAHGRLFYSVFSARRVFPFWVNLSNTELPHSARSAPRFRSKEGLKILKTIFVHVVTDLLIRHGPLPVVNRSVIPSVMRLRTSDIKFRDQASCVNHTQTT